MEIDENMQTIALCQQLIGHKKIQTIAIDNAKDYNTSKLAILDYEDKIIQRKELREEARKKRLELINKTEINNKASSCSNKEDKETTKGDNQNKEITKEDKTECKTQKELINLDNMPYDHETLRNEQKQDIKIIKQIKKIQTNSLDKEKPVQFKLINGIFSRYTINENRQQIVVPKTLVEKTISMSHSSAISGHIGINKTLETIQTNFWWKGMKKGHLKIH